MGEIILTEPFFFPGVGESIAIRIGDDKEFLGAGFDASGDFDRGEFAFIDTEFIGVMSSTNGKDAGSVGSASELSLTCLMSDTAGRKVHVGAGRVCMQKFVLGEGIPIRPGGRGGVKEYV